MLDVGGTTFLDALRTGIDGLSLFFGYKWTKYGFKNRNYVQLSESEYTL
jgi:hypothetical protein